MTFSTAHWKTIHRWLLAALGCGLAWGATVALLMTLLRGMPNAELPWQTMIVARTQIGALVGAFFGLLAGLLIAQERLRMNFTLLTGRSALLLLGTASGYFGGGFLFYQMVIARWLVTVPWQSVVAQYRLLFYGATIAVIPLILVLLLAVLPTGHALTTTDEASITNPSM